MSELFWIFFSTLLVNNFTLAYFLGLCPFLGVSGKLETALRLGLANIFVMLIRCERPDNLTSHVTYCH